ncbi:MAG: single-stranded-DNA-specific exonuclease RecJ [Chloroflexota bacterium]|nr:MAG: single-stranded-DNA-specific exonuclease RecJ [Chloroflexota bacterium]
MTHWLVSPQPDIPAELLEFAGDPFLAQLLAQRDLTTVEQARAFLSPDAYQPASPEALPDMGLAVNRLLQAIEQQETICVWGDFDVDGQTATALLVSTLRDLGAKVRFYIPNRLAESHGIKLPSLRRILADGTGVILTCDTGIAEHEAIAVAQAAGVEVIVTDHHDLAETLPPARAVINPKRLPPDHPLRELPGVGVAYKLAEGLYQACGRSSASEGLLDLVALGIVADVAQQTGDTRYLLQKGLAVLSRTPRLGLQLLIESAKLAVERLTEAHIGFWLAPRLNALGRLGDATLAVELLTTSDLTRARIIALQLEALNDRRKLLVDRVVVQALGQLEDTPSLAEYNAIVLAAADWHPGVLGIAASRLIDQFGKPAILLALRPDEPLARGSARSVPGCDIHQALKTQAHLLHSFGGHPRAAGLALAPDNIAAFRRGLSAALDGCRPDQENIITLDALVELPQISPELLASIQRLAPFGEGNPPVRLGCTGLHIAEEKVFGKTSSHKRVVIRDAAGFLQEIIWWGGAAEPSPQGTFDLAFTLSPDDFNGGGIQVEWLAAREWMPAPAIIKPEFIDWRQVGHLQSKIENLKSKILWSEGFTLPNLSPLSRHQLAPAETLVIWTAPPGQDIYQQALQAVKPRHIFLVGQPSPFDTLTAFIRQLLGLIKYALTHKEGEVNLDELAAALGHRTATVRLGIDWLAVQGKLSIYADEGDILVLRPAHRPPRPEAGAVENLLQAALAETAAYRRFFREASLTALQKVS